MFSFSDKSYYIIHVCIVCMYIYIYIHDTQKVFGTSCNRRGVPTSFSIPVLSFGA